MRQNFRNCLVTSFAQAPHWDQVLKEAYESGYPSYVCGQLEMCPDTSKEHLQAYVELKAPNCYALIRKIFDDPTIHIEPIKYVKGQGPDQYCMKEETRLEGPLEFGDKKKYGGDHKSATFGELRRMTFAEIETLSGY